MCDLVKNGLQRQVDTNLNIADSCRKATASCSLSGFLIQNQASLQTIDADIEPLNKALRLPLYTPTYLKAAS